MRCEESLTEERDTGGGRERCRKRRKDGRREAMERVEQRRIMVGGARKKDRWGTAALKWHGGTIWRWKGNRSTRRRDGNGRTDTRERYAGDGGGRRRRDTGYATERKGNVKARTRTLKHDEAGRGRMRRRAERKGGRGRGSDKRTRRENQARWRDADTEETGWALAAHGLDRLAAASRHLAGTSGYLRIGGAKRAGTEQEQEDERAGREGRVTKKKEVMNGEGRRSGGRWSGEKGAARKEVDARAEQAELNITRQLSGTARSDGNQQVAEMAG
ncbi:hypothetical protein C8R44DRAFT_744700 [Mycena epipterygia]|nr:hypothetical protein C8R44DRAFT_744700 [Mycena epipterygia]